MYKRQVYNSNANARYGQDSSQTPGVQTATTSAQVNRVELDRRPTDVDAYAASGLGVRAAHTGTGTVIDSCCSTGRQSAGVNTGGRAAPATAATRTCNDVRTIYPTYIVPLSSDENADFFDVDVDGLVSLFDECESPANDSIDANNVKLNVAEFDMDRFIACLLYTSDAADE